MCSQGTREEEKDDGRVLERRGLGRTGREVALQGAQESASVLCRESRSPDALNLNTCLVRLQIIVATGRVGQWVIFHLPVCSHTTGRSG